MGSKNDHTCHVSGLQKPEMEDEEMSDRTFTAKDASRLRECESNIQKSISEISHIPEDLYQEMKRQYLAETKDDPEIQSLIIAVFEGSRTRAKINN